MNERTGSLWERNGQWGFRVTYTDANGKRRDIRRTCRGEKLPNKKSVALDELKRRVMREVDRIVGASASAAAPKTAHDLLTHFAETYVHAPVFHDGKKVSGYRSWRSMESYLKILRRVMPNKALGQLTYEDVRQVKLALVRDRIVTERGSGNKKVRSERPRSTANIHRVLAALRACLSLAESQRWIEVSPWPKKGDRRERLISPKNETQRMRILSDGEESCLLGACVDERSHLKPYVIALLDTGMRLGELCALERRAIDFEEQTIRVYATKTEEPRVVPMSDRLRTEMLAWGDDRLRPELKPFGMTTIKTAWRRALAIAKIDGLRIHDLRHTAATRMIEGGMELAEVARILGHKDIRTTYRYVNAHAGTVSKAATVINRANEARETLSVN